MIDTLVVGPLQENTYFIIDEVTKKDDESHEN